MSDVAGNPPSNPPSNPPPEPAAEAAQRRDYDLAANLEIDTTAQLKALGDPLRNTIVDLVLERAMSVTELAEQLQRPRGSVAYHVDVLVDAGLLNVVRTRRVRAIEERFYGRTALTYVLPHAPGEIPFIRDVLAEMDVSDREDSPEVGMSTYRHARIPNRRVEEFTERLYALALEFAEEPRSGDTEFGLYIALYPTNRLPAKPTNADSPTPAMIHEEQHDEP